MPETHSTGSSGFLPARIGNMPITIAGTDVTQITYKGDPVVTFAMVDDVHQRPAGTARRNFNENRPRFKEGEDFLNLNQPDEIRSLGFERPQGGTPASVILLTQRGYLKLTKPMTDDRSSEVQGEMIDRYFSVEAAKSMTPAEFLLEQVRMMVEVERKQAELAAEQAEQSSRIATTERRLDQIETAADHFTCIGYARWAKHTSLNTSEAAKLGRKASKRCRELGIKIGTVPDARFGTVNQFPKAILDEAWEEVFGRAA